MALRRCYSANRVKPGGQQLSLFSAHCAAQSLQFFARAPEGQMWPGSRCLDVHRRIVETEWSDACEWCMGAGQDSVRADGQSGGRTAWQNRL